MAISPAARCARLQSAARPECIAGVAVAFDDRGMNVEQDTTAGPELGARCWCCDEVFEEQELVRLGSHPEVALCGDCARWVHRRAVERRYAGRRGPGPRARAGIRSVRGLVMQRGWQERRVVGPVLRWVDRFLP